MKKAFTLSEVLIALTIIGVVAAITVPTLFANYTEQEKSQKIKKEYSTLSNAITRVRAFGGSTILDYDINDDLLTVKTWFDDFLKPQLVTTKVCYNTPGCWSSEGVKYLNGSTANGGSVGIGYPTVTAVLNDGTYISVDRDSVSSFGVNSDNQYGLIVYFDINGNKKPNVVGKDIFITVFTEEGFVPAFRHSTKAKVDKECSKNERGRSCIMKYLKS